MIHSKEKDVPRATTPPPGIREDPNYDGAEWNIVEDYALLQSVQQELASGHTVERNHDFPGLQFNWDLVALAVNKQTRFYRSPRQCSIRYQKFVRPKQLHQLVVSDPITKRNIKVDFSTRELVHLRRGRITTESQYEYDYGTLTDEKHLNRFKAVKMASQKPPLSFWRGPKDLDSRQLNSLNDGLPANHMNKLKELDVHPGLIQDAEEVLTMSEDEIEDLDQQKKAWLISIWKMKTFHPRQESRFPYLVERPYAFPLNKELKPMPPRRNMIIALPSFQLPSPTVNQHPAASAAPSTSSDGGPQSMASHPELSQGGGEMQGDNREDLDGMHLNQGDPIHHEEVIGDNHSQAPAHLLNVNSHHGHQLPPIGTIVQDEQPAIPIQQISQDGGQQQVGGGYIGMSGLDGGPGGSQDPHPQSQQAQRVRYVPRRRRRCAKMVVMRQGGRYRVHHRARVCTIAHNVYTIGRHRVRHRAQRPPATLPNGGRIDHQRWIEWSDHQRQNRQNVVPVRVKPARQRRHRVKPAGSRRAPPMPDTVAAKEPNRNNSGGGPQNRTMQVEEAVPTVRLVPGIPQFPQIRDLVRQDPNNFDLVVHELETTFPSLAEAIKNNKEEFMNVLNGL